MIQGITGMQVVKKNAQETRIASLKPTQHNTMFL